MQLKYKEGEFVGTKGILFIKRLPKNRGVFKCPYDGKEFEGFLGNIVNDKIWHCGCQQNHYKAGSKIGPHKIEMLKRDEDNSQKGWFICPYHNDKEHIFNAWISGILSGNQYHCGCLHKKEYFPNDRVGPDGLLFYKRDESNKRKAWFVCPYHKEQVLFNAYISNILNHNSWHCGCQDVNSKGEKKIREILTNLNINFQQEKTFDNLFDVKKLRFDFYLPDYNCCIEYDGRQHYNVNSTWSKEKSDYEIIQLHDKMKDDYCLKNNIKLIRVSYFEYKNLNEKYILEKLGV